MVYRCVMRQSRIFYMEADSDDNAIDWVQTHSLQDVDNLTKEYRDEFDESVYLPDNQEDLKPHFSITKEKSEKESEDEFMNESMTRLKALIDESKKIREDVETETKRLETEHLENKKAQYNKLCEILKPYFELCKGIIRNNEAYLNVFVSTDKVSKYEIRFETGYDIGIQEAIHDGCNHWIGRFNLVSHYENAYIRIATEDYRTGKKTYYLDDFMDSFDEDVLEENFSAIVTEQLSKLAAETDKRYQDAKADLEKDNQ